jgi:D-alanyl-lipoteichoic acid acyltransferase DltB (MBOAT superfamily)
VLARNVFLLLAGWYFYAVWDWRFLFLLIGTSTFDYLVALGIERTPEKDVRRRKLLVVGSLVVNLGVLGFFKYCNFFIDSFVSLAHSVGWKTDVRTLSIILPVGVSFYTFQSIAYVIDVYRRHLRAESNFVHYATFVGFFPQLVAGPIERATHLLPQIKAPNVVTWNNFSYGFCLVSFGLFKKIVLADNLAPIVSSVFNTHDVTPQWWESIFGIYAFAFQIYCDFSAYSDIARGAARMMGFDLMRNFDLPYFAVNPSDFWRRWHISLSTWLRDYLYIPLGGNRGGVLVAPVRWAEDRALRARRYLRRRRGTRDETDETTGHAGGVIEYERRDMPPRSTHSGVNLSNYFNLMVTMLLGGLWHGATWLFVLWGAYHGIMLCVHRALQPILRRYFTFRAKPQAALWTFVRIVVFFQFTCVGWLLFRAIDWNNFVRIVRPWHHDVPLLVVSGKPLYLITAEMVVGLVVIAVLLMGAQLCKYLADNHEVIFRIPVPVRAVIYAAMILGMIVYGEFGGGDFIYFQF